MTSAVLRSHARQAAWLLIAELARLDRDSGGALLRDVSPGQVYEGAVTMLMRLLFLQYARERHLLPPSGAPAPPRPGGLFDTARHPWLAAVSDQAALGALLALTHGPAGPERPSRQHPDIEQLGHVYETLLEFSCHRPPDPALALAGPPALAAPAGHLLLTRAAGRRATGTHYTPRPLARELVQHTLEPLCYDPGPADGAAHRDWRVRPAAELLALRVLDPAMGSGAFLMSACRFLGDRLAEAWERDGHPPAVEAVLGPAPGRDAAILAARRRVAASCLYGVDRDEAAVELARLSLWLLCRPADQPFSFLDHALRCGDALVGLTSAAQLAAFHPDPPPGHPVSPHLAAAITDITSKPPEPPDPARLAKPARLRLAADPADPADLARLRLAADAVTAAALSTAGQPAAARTARLDSLAADAERIVRGDATPALEREFREKITTWLRGPRPEPIRPLHWFLEFPEVMARGGFTAIVSNPPFMGGQRLTRHLGADLREYLVRDVGQGRRGSADLCAYFLLRYLSVVAPSGRAGLIATNTVAQGDTREVGLAQAEALGWEVYRAEKSRPWPGAAALEVSLLWAGRPAPGEQRVLDGRPVRGITSRLDPAPRIPGSPRRLAANAGQSFQGSNILGTGFTLPPAAAQALISKDPRNADVLFPYLNGADLNSRWDCSARRWVINFRDWPASRAAQYPDCLAIVEQAVRPARARNPDRRRREIWWQFTRPALDLYQAIAGFDRVLVFAQTSRTQMPALVPARQVLSHMLVVIAADEPARLALHSSELQYSWTARYSAGLKADLRFIPSDCFETFPRPAALPSRARRAGEALDRHRQDLMERRRIGLTAVYNLLHDQAVADPDIAALRDIHEEADNAVRDAYAADEDADPAIGAHESALAQAPLPSWRDLDLRRQFRQTSQGARFTITPQARADLMDKLLALNLYRHARETQIT